MLYKLKMLNEVGDTDSMYNNFDHEVGFYRENEHSTQQINLNCRVQPQRPSSTAELNIELPQRSGFNGHGFGEINEVIKRG